MPSCVGDASVFWICLCVRSRTPDKQAAEQCRHRVSCPAAVATHTENVLALFPEAAGLLGAKMFHVDSEALACVCCDCDTSLAATAWRHWELRSQNLIQA